jgi:hypothetical protein
MSVAQRVASCFRERSLSCTRLQGLVVGYAELSSALCGLSEHALIFRHGQVNCGATWTSVLTRLLAVERNRGPVFAALRDVCGVVLALCRPGEREAADTTRLLILFAASAMRHGAPQDDIDFFLMVLREIALRTGCPDVSTSVYLFISHLTQ